MYHVTRVTQSLVKNVQNSKLNPKAKVIPKFDELLHENECTPPQNFRRKSCRSTIVVLFCSRGRIRGGDNGCGGGGTTAGHRNNTKSPPQQFLRRLPEVYSVQQSVLASVQFTPPQSGAHGQHPVPHLSCRTFAQIQSQNAHESST